MIEKQQPIVALGHSTKPKKARPPRNNLFRVVNRKSLNPFILNDVKIVRFVLGKCNLIADLAFLL